MAVDVRVAAAAENEYDTVAHRERLAAELFAADKQIVRLRRKFTALRSLLISSQASWSSCLEGLSSGGSEHAVVSRAEDLLEICTQLARVEARLEGAVERQASLNQALNLWNSLASNPGVTDDGGEIEVRGVPVADRIERQLDHLARREHAAIARRVVTGPMQELADFAVSLEVVQQHVEWDPATAVQELRLCRTSLDHAMASMRAELSRLRPPRNAEECVAQLRSLLSDVADVETRVDILGNVTLMSDDHAVAVSRIAEKACENALLHGRAGRVEIALSVTQKKVSLVVRDDGDGFDVSATHSRLGRINGGGIISMRERAQHGAGTLEIRSTIDVGTEVRATFPVTPPDGDRGARR